MPGNNSATDTTAAAPQADLAMAKTVSNPLPNVGTNVTFTLTVTNNGPSVASDVVVNDLLPSGYALCRRRRREAATTAATGVWTMGTLASGGSATLTITATVLASGNYRNTATASASTPDPNTGNNTRHGRADAGAVADLTASKASSADAVRAGGAAELHHRGEPTAGRAM